MRLAAAGRHETTEDRYPSCSSDYSVTLAGAVQVGEGWHDEREYLTCGQHFRRAIGASDS